MLLLYRTWYDILYLLPNLEIYLILLAIILFKFFLSCFEKLHETVSLSDLLLCSDLEKVAFLLGISVTDFTKSIVKPRIKVGREFVNQGRSMQQVCDTCSLKLVFLTLMYMSAHQTCNSYYCTL